MLIFGHVGLTAGIVKILQSKMDKTENESPGGSAVSVGTRQTVPPGSLRNLRPVDYRLISFGALLPDIIDKTIWLFSPANFQWSGRGYSHTLLFGLMLLITGLLLAARRKYWLLTVAAGSLFHVVFDQMWLDPTALWWPLMGPIQRGSTAGWLAGIWDGLLANPYVYVSETLGLLLVSYTLFRLLKTGRLMHFIKTGDISLSKPGLK